MKRKAESLSKAVEPAGAFHRTTLASASCGFAQLLCGAAFATRLMIAVVTVTTCTTAQALALLGHMETVPAAGLAVQPERVAPREREALVPAASGALRESARAEQGSVVPAKPMATKALPFFLVGTVAVLILAALLVGRRARAAHLKRAKNAADDAAAGRLHAPRLDQAQPGSGPGTDDDLAFPAAALPARNKQPLRDSVAAADLQQQVDHIVDVHIPGRGLQIVAAGVSVENTQVFIDLARVLADKGRSIIVDLDRRPERLAPLGSSGGEAANDVVGLLGLSELLIGDASYAEVIHRDHASRLHFIPTGHLEADFRDFDLILDALTVTYDFIVMLAPAYPQSEIVKIMAPYADFVVLAPAADADRKFLAEVQRQLADAGACEVLVAGRDLGQPHQQVA